MVTTPTMLFCGFGIRTQPKAMGSKDNHANPLVPLPVEGTWAAADGGLVVEIEMVAVTWFFPSRLGMLGVMLQVLP